MDQAVKLRGTVKLLPRQRRLLRDEAIASVRVAPCAHIAGCQFEFRKRGARQVHPSLIKILGIVPKNVCQLKRQPEVAGAVQRGLGLGTHHPRHHQPDHARDPEAVQQGVIEGLVAVVLHIHAKAGQVFQGIAQWNAVTLGHLLETTGVARNASALSGMIGKQIASPVVTYVDDGTTANGWGSSRFDDEGAPTESTVLIRNGVLESYMVDRWGSLVTGYRPTGSGRRQDYTYAPTSRMRNTIVERGDTPREKLFEGIEYGLYASSLGGGQVKPGSGEYNFAVTEGFLIRNGEIAEPVRGAMLLGKGPDSIKKIVAVSDDLNNEPGMCGSMSGSIPVEIGQPHLLVSELVVGGEA